MTREEITAAVKASRDESMVKKATLTIFGKEEWIPARNGGKVRVLVNRPEAPAGPVPVFFNFHGGGFIMGMPEFDDTFCQRVCDELGVVVVNVDYRVVEDDDTTSEENQSE